jgi:spore photoproduct lyase
MERSLNQHYPLYSKLEPNDRLFLSSLFKRYHFSFQQKRLIIEIARDLWLWQRPSIAELWNEDVTGEGKVKTRKMVASLEDKVNRLRKEATDYNDFKPNTMRDKKQVRTRQFESERLLGRCPCPPEGEVLRCCNLLTLDAVQQCGFGCSYCSIQTFYHDEVLFVENLKERLANLTLPQGTWHIGTGQASDSLMWGNRFGILETLAHFAHNNPSVVLEMKSKAARSDWLKEVTFTPNVLFTWSLNAPTIVEKEEHLTASLGERIRVAREVADAGYLVGFHLHPLVHFTTWREEYGAMVDLILQNFSPQEVVMISLGTLTFTKEVLKQLRESNLQSRILQMELSETFGKYSYPLSLKEELFSYLYSLFPPRWRTTEGPFFYLCMEDPQLWEPVFGYAYPDNATFEEAMKRHYFTKIRKAIDNIRASGNN